MDSKGQPSSRPGGRLRRFLTIAVAVLVVLIGLLTGTMYWSHQPGFCVSCHLMEPYYENWKASAHSGVHCLDCHYEPGWKNELKGKFQSLTQLVTYLNGTYDTNPSAQISDASCLTSGCHDERLLHGEVTFLKNIKFDHLEHLGKTKQGITLKCTSCHSQIVQGSHISVTKSVCFSCHFKGITPETFPLGQDFCTKCHEAPARDIEIGDLTFNHSYYISTGVACQRCHQDVIKGEGKVSDDRCMQCHPEEERLRLKFESDFMHEKHVTDVKVECFECHDEIRHELPLRGEPPSTNCDICHRGSHKGPSQIYSGIGGRGIDEPMPAPMFQVQVDCIGCHIKPGEFGFEADITGWTYSPTVDACIACHRSVGEEYFNAWTERLSELVTPIEAKLKTAKKALDSVPEDSPKYGRMKANYDDALYNYDFILYGKGIHNIRYTEALLEKSDEWLDLVIAEAGG